MVETAQPPLYRGVSSGAAKRQAVANGERIYYIFCPQCQERFWFALPNTASDEEVKRWHGDLKTRLANECPSGHAQQPA